MAAAGLRSVVFVEVVMEKETGDSGSSSAVDGVRNLRKTSTEACL